MESVVISLMDAVKAGGAILIPFTLWGVKKLVHGQGEIRGEVQEMRKEFKEYVSKEQCALHRESIQMQIDALSQGGGRRGKHR